MVKQLPGSLLSFVDKNLVPNIVCFSILSVIIVRRQFCSRRSPLYIDKTTKGGPVRKGVYKQIQNN